MKKNHLYNHHNVNFDFDSFYIFTFIQLNSEVVDDPDIEIIEKNFIVNQTDANLVEIFPFPHNKNELQHSDLGNLATGPYGPILNVS